MSLGFDPISAAPIASGPNSNISVSISETLAVADQPYLTINLLVEEVIGVADTTNRSKVFTASVVETIGAEDTDYPFNAADTSDTMAVADLFNVGVDGRWYTAVRETAAITDSDGRFFNLVVAETIAVRDGQDTAIDGVVNVAVLDFLGITDTPVSTDKTNSVVPESLGISDSIGVYVGDPSIRNVSVAEAIAISDTSIDPETFSSPGLYFWGYKWAFDAGIQKLAVWCAGLDCGDHVVSPVGYVFVPWQSDADALFTPAYLMNLSNNPPVGGFGASAVNIDITTNTGALLRVTVDVAIGVPYTSQLQLLPPNAPDQNHSPAGPSLAETRRLHQYGAKLVNAQSISVGTNTSNLRPVQFRNAKGDKYPANALQTRTIWDVIDDDYDFDGMLMMQMSRPYPATIAALISFLRTQDRG